jgi:hypothetical protein
VSYKNYGAERFHNAPIELQNETPSYCVTKSILFAKICKLLNLAINLAILLQDHNGRKELHETHI